MTREELIEAIVESVARRSRAHIKAWLGKGDNPVRSRWERDVESGSLTEPITRRMLRRQRHRHFRATTRRLAKEYPNSPSQPEVRKMNRAAYKKWERGFRVEGNSYGKGGGRVDKHGNTW